METQKDTIFGRFGPRGAVVTLLTAQVFLGCGSMDEEEFNQELRSLVPADQETTVGGTSFAWSSAGPIVDMECVQIVEPSDPHSWSDNYFCSSEDVGMVWSYAGPVADMQCTQTSESSDPYAWFDNYLCLPVGSPFEFTWNSAGGRGPHFVRWLEAADPDAWDDNYLTVAKNWAFCAPEGRLCGFPGTQRVRYGANGTFVEVTSSRDSAARSANHDAVR